MKEQLADRLIAQAETLPINEGRNKSADLAQAVRAQVLPGMSLYFCFTHARAHAAAFEIARQFRGTNPRFHLISAALLEFGVVLLHSGLLAKVTSAFRGNTYPVPGPNHIVQEALKNGSVAFEDWTNLTLNLSLMAGALDLPFIPTKSIAESNLATENSGFAQINNPFGDGKIGVISATKPDLAIVHGAVADRNGNTIITGPYGDDVWGALAASKGVIVTVEKIVSTEFIRKHAHLVRIPGHVVTAVCETPFGAHPQPMTEFGMDPGLGYGEDYTFRSGFRDATRDPSDLDAWIKSWVSGCNDHDGYLAKLGSQRLNSLRGRLDPDAWRQNLAEKRSQIKQDAPPNAAEKMVISATRGIMDAVEENNYSTLLAGAGIAALAAWTAAYFLRRDGVDIELMSEAGFYGYHPRFGDPYVFSADNMFTNKMQTGFLQTLGVFSGGNVSNCLAVIGAGQIDRNGNINTTRMTDDFHLVGSGGANDLGASAAEVMVLCQQSKTRFVSKVAYVTTSGKRVSRLYSTRGVFEKFGDSDELILTAVHGNAGSGLEETIAETGWDLAVKDELGTIDAPTAEELAVLRLFDPDRLLIK